MGMCLHVYATPYCKLGCQCDDRCMQRVKKGSKLLNHMGHVKWHMSAIGGIQNSPAQCQDNCKLQDSVRAQAAQLKVIHVPDLILHNWDKHL